MKRLVILLCAIAATSALMAQTTRQITFANKGISVGENWTSPYRVNIANFNGVEFSKANGWLKFDLCASQLSISGSNNIVQFYDKETDFFNAVRCSYFNVMSDSCLKTDIRPLDGVRQLFDQKYMSSKVSEASGKAKKEAASNDFLGGIIDRYPDLVSKSPEGATLLNYAEIVPILVKEIQEVDDEIAKISEEINQLKNDLP